MREVHPRLRSAVRRLHLAGLRCRGMKPQPPLLLALASSAHPAVLPARPALSFLHAPTSSKRDYVSGGGTWRAARAAGRNR